METTLTLSAYALSRYISQNGNVEKEKYMNSEIGRTTITTPM